MALAPRKIAQQLRVALARVVMVAKPVTVGEGGPPCVWVARASKHVLRSQVL
eukprot:COSAG05_NODE_103_length_19033_cov_99.004278_5_plen_52_part_00